MDEVDVLIVGGGPAGATAARILSAKYSVMVLEKKLPGASKLCGGLLAPAAQKALDGLGLVLPESVKVEPQLRTVRAVDWDSGLERTCPRIT